MAEDTASSATTSEPPHDRESAPVATSFRDTDPEHMAKVAEVYQRISDLWALQEQQQDAPIPERIRSFVDVACIERYLRARSWNVDKAFEMLSGTLTWRTEYNPEAISLKDIYLEARTGKMYVSPFRDKQGRSIIYMKPGLDDTTDRVSKVKYLVMIVEDAIRHNNYSETGVEKITLLVDYTGCGFKLAGVENTQISLDVLNILQNHYPERLGLAFMINPPWIFSAFWKIISRFLDPVTANKIIFTDKSGSATLEHIDAENLETVYAGTNDFQYNYEQWRESRFPGETLDSDE